MKCTNITVQSRHHSRNSNSLRLKAKYRNMAKFSIMTLFSVDSGDEVLLNVLRCQLTY